MSLGPVSPDHSWFSTTTAAGRPGGRGSLRATAHQLVPNDPLSRALTDDDRALLKSATGIDVRADGGIVPPRTMNAGDRAAALGVAGQIAVGRANGSTAAVSAADLALMLGWAGFSGRVPGGPPHPEPRA